MQIFNRVGTLSKIRVAIARNDTYIGTLEAGPQNWGSVLGLRR